MDVSSDLATVLSDWAAHMYDHCHALHHLDVMAGAWTYRVFLLANALQVDLAFVTETEFRALAPTFRLISGTANEPRVPSPPQAAEIAGMAWLYALHARSCLARGKLWQAEYMVSGIRDNALALACLRHGLATVHGRGFDLLPIDVTSRFEESLVRQLSPTELSRAFQAVVRGLLYEIRGNDAGLEMRLRRVLTQLAEIPV